MTSKEHRADELIPYPPGPTLVTMRQNPEARLEHLFVYGSLKRGHENAHLLEAIGGSWRAASVVGVMRPTGWGAGMGYPALTLDASGGAVRGFVFSSSRLADHWAELDAFEGSDYRRVVAIATLDDGGTIEAQVYVGAVDVAP